MTYLRTDLRAGRTAQDLDTGTKFTVIGERCGGALALVKSSTGELFAFKPTKEKTHGYLLHTFAVRRIK